jgi:hypothetical protein
MNRVILDLFYPLTQTIPKHLPDTHIHFEIYRSLAEATNAANKIQTSQLALPEDVCSTVFESATGYSQSVNNLSQTSLDTDNVFRDGVTEQLATVTGNPGYLATLSVGVAV